MNILDSINIETFEKYVFEYSYESEMNIHLNVYQDADIKFHLNVHLDFHLKGHLDFYQKY